jgi:hypothetical protein
LGFVRAGRARSREEPAPQAKIPMKKRRFSCFVPQKRPAPIDFVKKSSLPNEGLKTYKEEAGKMDQIIKSKYEVFYKAPESHPKYKDEWLKFWEKRCGELQTEGKDPKTYDFRDEWKKSFLKRLNDMEFLEKSESRSRLFKEHMTKRGTRTPSPQKSSKAPQSSARTPPGKVPRNPSPRKQTSPARVPFKRFNPVQKDFRRMSIMSPTRKPIFKRLGEGENSRTPPYKKHMKRERSMSRSRSRTPPRRRNTQYRSPRRSRSRSRSVSREKKVPIKDRLQLMSKGGSIGNRRLTISGEKNSTFSSQFS